MNINATDLGKIQMLPYHLPVMSVGNYEITVQHTLGLDSESDTFTTTQAFEVTGSRYGVDQDIVQLFPAHNEVGKFLNLLPQIVLNNKSLPWEKDNLFKDDKDDVEKKNKPWLGLLLFREGEDFTILTDQESIDAEKGPRFNPEPDVFKQPGPLAVVDVDVNLFFTIAPTPEELALLAHVREEIPSASQSAAFLQTLKDISTDTERPKYSIVVCNRLPKKGSMHTACLVSFEGWGKILNDRKISDEKGEFQKVRLRVMKSWKFTDNTEDVTFSSYLKKMNTDAKGQPLGNLSLKLPPLAGQSPAIEAANKAFNLGFVPLQHHLRNGDKTISFYRGPLIPYDNTADNKMDAADIKGTDSSIRYNSQTAMFNESYAAAYQLGKLLALGSQSVAQAILNHRTEQQISMLRAAQKENLKQALLPEKDSGAYKNLLAETAAQDAETLELGKLIAFKLQEAIELFSKPQQ